MIRDQHGSYRLWGHFHSSFPRLLGPGVQLNLALSRNPVIYTGGGEGRRGWTVEAHEQFLQRVCHWPRRARYPYQIRSRVAFCMAL